MSLTAQSQQRSRNSMSKPASRIRHARDYVMDNSRGYNMRGKSQEPSRIEMYKAQISRSANRTTAPAVEEKLLCVPSRWSNTGWRYVLKEPSDSAFF